ncbi:hypothetical protein OG900_33215 [Streptomyces sp. NBC_00433]
MTGQPLNGTTMNGTKPRVPLFEGWQPIHLGGIPAQPEPEPEPIVEPVTEPRFDPVALAEADRIRRLADAEAEAVRTRAVEDAEKQRIANERAAMRLDKERADHVAHLAKKAAETAKANAEEDKANAAAEDEAARDAARDAEQQRSESLWKWGARGIYAVGLAIAAPVQFVDFWDPHRKFLLAAPALLEGFALVLAAGAAWAVAHRRDVLPYRIGIMIGALIAATINLRGGLTNPALGLNAGLIGAIASLGGPIILMAYEHGIAQKTDGIPSRRDRRAERKRKAAEEAARDKARADRKAAEDKAAADKKARDDAAEAEQKRRDDDRQQQHKDVWKWAEAMRSARGLATVTEQLWADAWYRATGSKTVGVTPEMEAESRVAHDRMKVALGGSSAHVESHRPSTATKDPDAPDGRRFNGGTPPTRRPGDSASPHPIARTQARLERTADTPREDS